MPIHWAAFIITTKSVPPRALGRENPDRQYCELHPHRASSLRRFGCGGSILELTLRNSGSR